MKKLTTAPFLILFLLSMCCAVNAQMVSTGQILQQGNESFRMDNISAVGAYYTGKASVIPGTEGSKNYFPNFQSGLITIKQLAGKGAKAMPAKVQFNVLEQTIYFALEGRKDTLILLSDNVESVICNNAEKYIVVKDMPEATPGTTGTICRVWHEGKHTLLEALGKKILKGQAAGPYTPPAPNKLIPNNTIWVRNADNTYTKITLKKKNALEFFSNKKAQVDEYIQKNKLTSTILEDWAKVLQFYESL